MPKGRRKGVLEGLAQREEQALNLLYKHGPSTAKELQDHIGDDLSNATVRTILRNLEAKGYVKHKVKNTRFIYSPTTEKNTAGKRVFDTLIDTFFSGSLTDAVATFIDKEGKEMDEQELDELMSLIQKLKNQSDNE
ncbi:BlaI/MecI/CopY family transcriptional regulator [Marinicella sp. W31]|uniref:BlaI/MecI/CopY family transcriptional regulator n=1 Tax=Marinicella sp. W31 TaxID=3023713 RepID=UPI00375673ED